MKSKRIRVNGAALFAGAVSLSLIATGCAASGSTASPQTKGTTSTGISAVPAVIALVVNRYIVSGLLAGSVK